MLVLSRKVGEALLLGKEIRLVILGINRGQVKIGIDAPKDVTVLREEVLDKNKPTW
jgi:carbon storage regulator